MTHTCDLRFCLLVCVCFTCVFWFFFGFFNSLNSMDTGRRGVQLLNSLNKFISLTASSATIGHGPDHGFSVSQLKAVANFIRLNVLSPLRRLEPDISIPISREDE